MALPSRDSSGRGSRAAAAATHSSDTHEALTALTRQCAHTQQVLTATYIRNALLACIFRPRCSLHSPFSFLPPAPAPQLAVDVAELAQWSGQLPGVPEMRADAPVRSWNDYSSRGKVHLLQVGRSVGAWLLQQECGSGRCSVATGSEGVELRGLTLAGF